MFGLLVAKIMIQSQIEQVKKVFFRDKLMVIFAKNTFMSKTILLGHGSGGLMTSELIRNLFLKYLKNPYLELLSDSSVAEVGDACLAFTTDSYVVDPVFFHGGNIGKLAVCGTVNDLSMSGATPLYLTAGFILEEGFLLTDLEKIVISMAEEAAHAGVQIVAGDTKVVKKGQCDKIFINTAGVGVVDIKHKPLSSGNLIRPGDQLLVNGFLGDHEIAVMASRENLRFEEEVLSDVACLNHMAKALLTSGADIHLMRDITRGGIATILDEMIGHKQVGAIVEEGSLPIRTQTMGLCELYGFDPLYLANEGKMLLVVDEASSGTCLEVMRSFDTGKDAALIGSLTSSDPGKVLLHASTGGTRILHRLAGEQLPRIC